MSCPLDSPLHKPTVCVYLCVQVSADRGGCSADLAAMSSVGPAGGAQSRGDVASSGPAAAPGESHSPGPPHSSLQVTLGPHTQSWCLPTPAPCVHAWAVLRACCAGARGLALRVREGQAGRVGSLPGLRREPLGRSCGGSAGRLTALGPQGPVRKHSGKAPFREE